MNSKDLQTIVEAILKEFEKIEKEKNELIREIVLKLKAESKTNTKK